MQYPPEFYFINYIKKVLRLMPFRMNLLLSGNINILRIMNFSHLLT
jgi:hypothetical protein